jgi:AAA family ATPase
MPHTLTDSHIELIASTTHGYVGSDLHHLCKQAALFALKRNFPENTLTDISQISQLQKLNQLKSTQVNIDDFRLALIEVRPSAMREIMVDIQKVKWEDIGGYDSVKQRLKESVEWPLKYPEKFTKFGISPPRGVLLYGPPGCSKTLTAKALATETGLNFIPVKGPELFSKYVGDSEKAVREIFRKARQAAPSVVFFDELDAIAVARGTSGDGNSVGDRVLSQMLNELDGVSPLNNVLFLAATNRPDIIDEALMRSGRIDRIIYIPPPDLKARIEIFKILYTD